MNANLFLIGIFGGFFLVTALAFVWFSLETIIRISVYELRLNRKRKSDSLR